MGDSMRAVQNQTSSDEFIVYKRGVGHVMYKILEQIVEPICKQHPPLGPASNGKLIFSADSGAINRSSGLCFHQ